MKFKSNATLIILGIIISIFAIIQTRISTTLEITSNSTKSSSLFIEEDLRKKEKHLQVLTSLLEAHYDKHYKYLHKELNEEDLIVFFDFDENQYKYFKPSDDFFSSIDLEFVQNLLNNNENLYEIAETDVLLNNIYFMVDNLPLKDYKQKLITNSKTGKFKHISPLIYISKTKPFDTGIGSYVPFFYISILNLYNKEKTDTLLVKEFKINTNNVINKKILSVMEGLDKVSNFISSKQKQLFETSRLFENSLAVKGAVYLSSDMGSYDFDVNNINSTGNCAGGDTDTCNTWYGVSSSGMVFLRFDDLYRTLSGSTENLALSSSYDIEWNSSDYWNIGDYKKESVNINSMFLFNSHSLIKSNLEGTRFYPEINEISSTGKDLIRDYYLTSNNSSIYSFCGLNSYCGFEYILDENSKMIKSINAITTAKALVSLFPTIGPVSVDSDEDLKNESQQLLVACGGKTSKGDQRYYLRGTENPFSFNEGEIQENNSIARCPDKVSNLLIDNTSPFIFGTDMYSAKDGNTMIYSLGVPQDFSCTENKYENGELIDLCSDFPIIYKKYFILKGQ